MVDHFLMVRELDQYVYFINRQRIKTTGRFKRGKSTVPALFQRLSSYLFLKVPDGQSTS